MRFLFPLMLFLSLNGATYGTSFNLIPQPSIFNEGKNSINLPLKLIANEIPAEAKNCVDFFNRLGREIQAQISLGSPHNLSFKLDNSLQSEEFRLEAHSQRLVLRAKDSAGFLYGCGTLLQILLQQPTKEFTLSHRPYKPWRGFMLDSARHFQKVDSILTLLDKLALFQINRFHWHLSDNDGWRIESKVFPLLNSVSSQSGRPLESERNGFYTTKEIHAVLKRAKELNITVIPEIDLPGHAAALVEAYPHLLCSTNKNHPPVSQRISNRDWKQILCVGNPSLWNFLKPLLEEVLTIFQNPTYFHMGGDEVPFGIWSGCPTCSKEMEKKGLSEREFLVDFLKEYAALLEERGTTPIYWCEFPDLKISPRAIAQIWRGRISSEHLRTALDCGIRCINSAGDYAYFDYPDFPAMSRSAWMPILPLKKVYTYPYEAPENKNNDELLLGGECVLWTEEVNEAEIDKRLFPRLLAFSEQMSSLPQQRHFNAFQKRLKALAPAFEVLGIEFSQKPSRKQLQNSLKATVKSSLPSFRSCYPEYAINGLDADAFVSRRAPKESDFFIISWKEAQPAKKLEIISGGFFIFDTPNGRIDDGTPVTITFEDGSTTTTSFKKGVVEQTLSGKVKTIQIDFKNEDEAISINEVILK